MTSRAALLAALAAASSTAGAQAIVGRVLLPDSATPAANIVITATAANGTAAGRVLSTSNGNYRITLKSAGTYELRALRIGFRPTTVRVTVPAGATVRRDIVVTAVPVAIEGITVTDDDDCTLKGKNAQTFLTLLDQARAALGATSLWEQSGALDVEMVRVTGRRDVVSYFAQNSDTFERVDTSDARQLALTRVFGSTPPETLAARGYVRAARDGVPIYDMPNAESLLSDHFVGTHCFRLRNNGDHADWIGLGFEPRRRVDDYVDVDGTLWLDRKSAELRRLDFQYANLPNATYHICDSIAIIPVKGSSILHDDPPFVQPKPGCWDLKHDKRNRLGLGGSAEFTRLSSGEWMVSRWELVTPPDSARYRPGHQWRNLRGQPPELCFTKPNCRTAYAMRPRVVVVAGTTARVVRDGSEIYRDTSADGLVDAMVGKRTRDTEGSLAGFVIDSVSGKRLAGAIVQSESPWLVARTDTAGIFRFARLPGGSVVLSVRCDGYASRRARVTILPGAHAINRVGFKLVSDTAGAPGPGCVQR